MNPFAPKSSGGPVTNYVVAGPLPIESMPESPRIRRVLLGDDPNADEVYDILAILAQLAVQYGQVQYVRQAAETIANPAQNDDAYGMARALAAFVRQHVVYVADPVYGEYVKSPLVMLGEIEARGRAFGDCDDHVLLYAALANSLGIVTRVLGVKLGGRRWDHVIASSRVNGQWLDIDLINKSGPDPEYSEKIIA